MPGVQKPHCSALRSTNACLQVRDLAGLGQALDGDDLGPVGLHGQHQAAAHHRAIHPHRAGAADAVLAAQMRTGEAELDAQEIDEMLTYGHHAGDALAVDGERNCHRLLVAHAAARRAFGRYLERAPRQHALQVQAQLGAALRIGHRVQVVRERGGRRFAGCTVEPSAANGCERPCVASVGLSSLAK